MERETGLSKWITPQFVVALALIGLFSYAYMTGQKDDTMKGAIIAAFSAAWGYYLGTSSGVARVSEQSSSSLSAMREMASRMPDLSTATVVTQPDTAPPSTTTTTVEQTTTHPDTTQTQANGEPHVHE